MTISLKAFVENMRHRENVDAAKRLSSAMIEDIHNLCMLPKLNKSIIVDKIGEAVVRTLLPKYTEEIDKSFVYHPPKNKEDQNVK